MINDKENTNLDNSLNNDTNPKEMTTLEKIKCSLKRMYDGDDKYAGNYLESGRGFAPLKEKLPVWIRETNEYYKKKFK